MEPDWDGSYLIPKGMYYCPALITHHSFVFPHLSGFINWTSGQHQMVALRWGETPGLAGYKHWDCSQSSAVKLCNKTTTYPHFRLPLPATRNPSVLSIVIDSFCDSILRVFSVSSLDMFVCRMSFVQTWSDGRSDQVIFSTAYWRWSHLCWCPPVRWCWSRSWWSGRLP